MAGTAITEFKKHGISVEQFYSNQITINKLLQLASENDIKIEEVELEQTYRFKTPELKHLEQNLYNPKVKYFEQIPQNIKIFLAKNQYSEIEEVAKKIYKLVRDENYRYIEI